MLVSGNDTRNGPPRTASEPDVTDAPPFPDSLCHRCTYLRLVRSGRGSTFLMCQEPSLPKYGPQPVRVCRGFAPAAQ